MKKKYELDKSNVAGLINIRALRDDTSGSKHHRSISKDIRNIKIISIKKEIDMLPEISK